MANEDEDAAASGARFSFGTRELRLARRAAELELEAPSPKTKLNGGAGCDPYNTSGSFDRRKNWARVTKR
jgi:hypothetical protein